MVLLSGPYHAMYAVPAASTATPGLCPVPIVRGVAAPARPAASSSPAMTHAIARAGLRTGRIIWASGSPVRAVFGNGELDVLVVVVGEDLGHRLGQEVGALAQLARLARSARMFAHRAARGDSEAQCPSNRGA